MKTPIRSADHYAAQLRAGKTVTDVAIAAGVTPSSVYMTLRRAGTPAAAVTASKRRIEYRELPKRPGYRVGHDGSVQSCVSPRTGARTEHWRDLTIRDRSNGPPYVQLGGSNGGRQRLSLRTLIREAWGVEAEDIIARCKWLRMCPR